jgi:hypothetical protein
MFIATAEKEPLYWQKVNSQNDGTCNLAVVSVLSIWNGEVKDNKMDSFKVNGADAAQSI